MPTIFTSDTQIEPAREAHFLLYGKLFFAILLPTLIYLVFWITSIEIPLPVDRGEEDLGLLVLLGVTNLVQFLLASVIVLQWKNHVYFLTNDGITERKGIITTTEEAYDMKNIRSVTLRQGILGKMFDFGDLIVHSTAPENTQDIVLVGIPHPASYQNFLQKFV